MGDTSPNLPAKAQMFMDLASQLTQFMEDHDSSSDMYKHLVVEFFNLIACAKQELSEYKEEQY